MHHIFDLQQLKSFNQLILDRAVFPRKKKAQHCIVKQFWMKTKYWEY